MNNEIETYLSPQEVAEMLKLHTRTVQNYVKSGKLPGEYISIKTVRIKKSDVEKFLKENTEKIREGFKK